MSRKGLERGRLVKGDFRENEERVIVTPKGSPRTSPVSPEGPRETRTGQRFRASVRAYPASSPHPAFYQTSPTLSPGMSVRVEGEH